MAEDGAQAYSSGLQPLSALSGLVTQGVALGWDSARLWRWDIPSCADLDGLASAFVVPTLNAMGLGSRWASGT